MKLEINLKSSKIHKFVEIRHSTFKELIGQRKTRREIRKYFETSKHTTYQTVWNAAKAVLRGKFMTVNMCIKKEKISQINNITTL